jgi:hypothetical protein
MARVVQKVADPWSSTFLYDRFAVVLFTVDWLAGYVYEFFLNLYANVVILLQKFFDQFHLNKIHLNILLLGYHKFYYKLENKSQILYFYGSKIVLLIVELSFPQMEGSK